MARAGSSTAFSPSSMALARTTSSSAVRSATLPISLRYIRTGSSIPIRSAARASRSSSASGFFSPAAVATSSSGSAIRVGWLSASRTSTPLSSATANSSSILSRCASGCGTTSRIWSWVMKPSLRPFSSRASIAAFSAAVPSPLEPDAARDAFFGLAAAFAPFPSAAAREPFTGAALAGAAAFVAAFRLAALVFAAAGLAVALAGAALAGWRPWLLSPWWAPPWPGWRPWPPPPSLRSRSWRA